MLQLIVYIIAGFSICVIIYLGVIKLIRMWTGCSDNEAVAKLQRFVNGTPVYRIEEDIGLQNEIWENVKKVIGEKRYNQLVDLNSTAINPQLYFVGIEGALPYIAVSIYYLDDTEKRVLENIIVNIVKRHLQIYGYYNVVLVVWKERYDLNMPYLQIRYARNDEEKRILELGIKNQRQIISMQNSVVTDDAEDDLNE